MDFDRRVTEGMIVRTAGGEKLGRVEATAGDSFLVRKGLFFPEEFSARFDQIGEVRDGEVWLRSAPRSLGPPKDFDAPLVEPELEEGLYIDKRVTEHDIRFDKHVITERREATVPVLHEELRVERVPVDSMPADPGQLFREASVTVPVHEEEVELTRRPVIREELRAVRAPRFEERRVASESHEVTEDTSDEPGRGIDRGYTEPDH